LLSAPTLLFLLTTPYQAAKEYEKRRKESNGKAQSLAEAEGTLDDFVGASVDRMVKARGVRTNLTSHPSSLSQPGFVFPYL
jgi:hypothetical protein